MVKRTFLIECKFRLPVTVHLLDEVAADFNPEFAFEDNSCPGTGDVPGVQLVKLIRG